MDDNKKKVTGSIILKAVIVAMSVFLIFAIYAPNTIWTSETAELEECHFRLTGIQEIHQLYFRANNAYTDTLQVLFDFAKADSRVMEVDSLLYNISAKDSTEKARTDAIMRLFLGAPITIDSLLNCPSSGLPYILELNPENKDNFKAKCPTVEHKVTQFYIFEKTYANHGEVNRNDKSW